MNNEKHHVLEYLQFLIENKRKIATVQIGKQIFKNTIVLIETKKDRYFLIFEEPEIIHLLDNKKEFEVNQDNLEHSLFTSALCMSYGGNHIEIDWD